MWIKELLTSAVLLKCLSQQFEISKVILKFTSTEYGTVQTFHLSQTKENKNDILQLETIFLIQHWIGLRGCYVAWD